MSALAESAHEIMGRWPSQHGWQRLETRQCGGRHRIIAPGADHLIYHRRRTDRVDDDCNLLEIEDDPPLIVVERISTSLCITRRFVRMNQMVNDSAVLTRGLGVVWTFDGDYGPAMRVHLNAENGHWIYGCTDDLACCGGYAAVWRD